LNPPHTPHHCSCSSAVVSPGLHPAGRNPGPVLREQKKWNKVRLEKAKNTDVNRKPGMDSAGGHNMLLQYKVMKVTHLMMIKATRGPQ